MINGLVFILIGLQLPVILADLDGSPGPLLVLAVAIGATVIVTRFVWVFPGRTSRGCRHGSASASRTPPGRA